MKARLEVTNNWGPLKSALTRLPAAAQAWGEEWARDSVHNLDRIYRDHLAHQGRGGEPPPLSDATKHLYDRVGEPDGSGIRNHITIEYEVTPRGCTAIFGIPEGQPSIVARVQNEGATIPVSDAMRGFLAAHGIFLKATTTHIEIPARYSWDKSIERARADSRNRLKAFWVEVRAVSMA
jgi:hypothetical protein